MSGINEKQSMAIDMLIEGTHNKTDIAKACGKSRQWLYDSVINDEICKAEADRRLHEISTDGINRIKSNLGNYINNIVALANNADSDKIKLDSNVYLINRVMGGITNKIDDISNKDDKDTVNSDQLENEFEKFKLKKVE
jgi:ABC-type antimicrobial peptide transport system permease subunit